MFGLLTALVFMKTVILAGFAAVKVPTAEVLRGQCTPYSAQAAEIVAIAVALENTPTTQEVAIFPGSDWVLWSLVDWVPEWKKRGMRSTDGKPIVHADKLTYMWALAEAWDTVVHLRKVRSHRKGTEESKWNNWAAKEARRVATERKLWQPRNGVGVGPIAAARKGDSVQIDFIKPLKPGSRPDRISEKGKAPGVETVTE